MNKRIEWVDISKFIAITIMVVGHIGLPKMISDLIHMPVFFILAGLVFDEKSIVIFGGMYHLEQNSY